MLVGCLPAAVGQEGASTLLVTPLGEPEGGQLTVLVTALESQSGRVVFDDVAASLAGRTAESRIQSFSEFAARQSALDPGWKPPFAGALVYYWGEDAPQEILDGVPRLFKALPPSTTVYAVHYAEGRRGFTTPRTAATLAGGDLDTVATLPSTRPGLSEPLRFAVGEISKEKVPLRFLILISDGRDHELGGDAAGFVALGRDLRQAGIATEVISFPAPMDQARNRQNLTALSETAGARLLEAHSPADLAGTIEGASLVFLDMVVLTVDVPTGARLWGGRVLLEIEARYGGTRAVGQTSVRLGSSLRWVLGLTILLVAAGLSVPLVFDWPKRTRHRRKTMLECIERWIRMGLPAERMVVDLSRRFPEEVAWLKDLDPDKLETAKVPHLRTKAGRSLLEQIQAKLAQARDPAREGHVGGGLVGQLALAVSAGLTPVEAAERIRARLPDEDWSAFARLGFREVARLLKDASAQYPDLGTLKGRRLVLDIQDALRDAGTDSLWVAWLVRAAGPGARGATLRLTDGETTIGRAEGSGVRLNQDGEVADRHAVVRLVDGHFVIAPAEGRVLVEGEAISEDRPLADGETIQVGREVLVFKCVVAG